MKQDNTIGCIEEIFIPEFGDEKIWAKIDSGAYSGALHCVRLQKYTKNGEPWLRFQPFDKTRELLETQNFETTHVRSASGHKSIRHIVPVTISLKGKKYATKIGLSKRDKLKFPVLIGRRFLREHGVLVDVRINQEYDKDGEITL